MHADYRTGNFLYDKTGITGILDWEMAHAGDPVEDVAWLMIKSWRWAGDDRVGGLCSRDEFIRMYEEAGGAKVDRDALKFWEVLGNVKFATLFLTGLKSIVEGILEKHGVRYTLERYVSGEPFYTAPGALSEGVTRAVKAETGLTPKYSTGGGTSDGRFIAPLGAQVVELGVINSTIHKVNESVSVADIDRLHRIYLNALREMLA